MESKMQLNFKFKVEALSSNRAYDNRRGGRALTKEADRFKKYIYLEAKNQLKMPKFDPENVWIQATYYFYSPRILTKKGLINKNKKDVSSCIKLLQDSIFDAMGLNDVLITRDSSSQFHAKDPFIFVNYNIWPLKTLNDVDYRDSH